MPLFQRKKPEEKPKTNMEEIKRLFGEKGNLPKLEGMPEIKREEKPKMPPEKKEEKPKFAPLFIKIDRYSFVLNLLNDLKATTMMVKNAIVMQKEIEKLAEENRMLIEDNINKIDDKLMRLDSEFIRPKGFKEELKIRRDKPGLDTIVDDLKTQVDGLKSELDSVS
ncbi:MAG: hypothetical protein COY38_02155 [Candidatus Aenigmarchaeota archaeon CG_4_10_14_0_8_um_filter_37_24]|nr:hypothetical protein [Candidatus Aenigmarchaeota archaeon]OIN87339.1 MAG: hypothetical protein AUJ50_02745 [Candidatus Aenigmarchaeota archaeon CG1_02_38_14]PIV69050.1 MAG: hypothetical protein COS07_02100 [Candidatus Aenigmarchaeota archaeon CG01_land_8_20_14_3_00_37_9]PIW41007.1 MAG: hypothetical protein COW21_04140 [Candidatus Aenigmarchaeota archaeon CG15_BIG_FIL_POST_REV_8_21_14_020_37_27]PIX50628.1 MAG: hypothetical protein COZ52_03015 [Candidatus Aenigmarchaeota archaeon CG_4_8_14_3_u